MRQNRPYVALGLRLVVMTAALLIPLVFYLDANEVFELPKAAVLKALAALAALLLLVRGRPLVLRSARAVALFLGACLLSMLHTPSTVASLERIWEISSIVVLMWAAETGAVPFGRLLGIAFLAHLLVTVYGAFQYLGLDIYLGKLNINWTQFGPKRVYSTMGNPDFLAAQTAFLLPVICCLYFGVRREIVRAALVLCFIFALPSLLYTQARGALLSFVAALAALGWLLHRYVYRLSLARAARWAGGIAVALAFLLYLLPTGHLVIERFMELKDPVKASSLQIRLFYWYSGWLMGRVTPPVGSGIGAFHLAGARMQGRSQQVWDEKWPRAADVVSPHLELYAHNDYAHLFAVIGPVGLGVFLWIMVCLLAAGPAALARAGNDPARWLLIGIVATTVSFYVSAALNFPMKVMASSHLFFACLVPVLLARSPFRPATIPLPANRIAVLLSAAAALLLAGRACGILTASHYLKTGHKLLQLSENSRQAGDMSSARARIAASFAYFERAAALRPDHKDAILTHYYSGKSRQNIGELDAAISDFTRSIEVFRDFPEAFQSRGLALLTQAMDAADPRARAEILAACTADLTRALFLNPKDGKTNFFMGMARRLEGRPEESLGPFRNAIRHSGNTIPDANYHLALSLFELKRPAEARQVLEALLARFPDHPGARPLLGRIERSRR